MDLRQLRYFAKVVESGSFSKAASKLHVAQPALSQHVRHMEEELGVVLLHRAASGVKAIEAGERLMAHAKRIIAEFAGISDSVGKALWGQTGRKTDPTGRRSDRCPIIDIPSVRLAVYESIEAKERDHAVR